MNAEFFDALDALEKTKGIPKEYMLERVEAALCSAYKRERGGDNVRVALNPEKKDIKVYSRQTVVEEVTNPLTEISLDDARKISKRYSVGDIVETEVKTKNFGRLSAQTAKQVIIQGIREAERGMIFESFSSKEHEILTGVVTRIDPRNGSVCSGIVCEELNGGDYRVIPLSDDSPINGVMKVGYIVKKNQILSSVGKLYIEKIQEFLHAAQGGLSN